MLSSSWLRIVQRIEVFLFARSNSLIRPFLNRLTLKFKALQTVTMCNSIWPKIPGELNLQQHRSEDVIRTSKMKNGIGNTRAVHKETELF